MGALLLNNVFLFSSALFELTSRAARYFEMILLARFLVGINAGVSMNVQPMYFGEIAPKHLRGAVTFSSAVFTAFSVMIGQVIGLTEVLGAESRWHYLLASNALPGLFQVLTLPWFPESPRFLLIDRGDKEACGQALRRLRGCPVSKEEMEEILQEKELAAGSEARSLWNLLSDRTLRPQVCIVTAASSAMMLCGNDSIYFYASYIFQAAGISSGKIQYVTIGTGACERHHLQPPHQTGRPAEAPYGRLCGDVMLGGCLHHSTLPAGHSARHALPQHGVHFRLHSQLRHGPCRRDWCAACRAL